MGDKGNSFKFRGGGGKYKCYEFSGGGVNEKSSSKLSVVWTKIFNIFWGGKEIC